MTRLTLRGLAERKLRSALTGFAVVLGVAMIAGTYIETDQIRNAFEDITSTGVAKLDVVITPADAFEASFDDQSQTIPERLVAKVGRSPGVAAAQGEIAALGNLVVDGEVVKTFGAPGLVIASGAPEFDPATTVSGRRVEGPGEAEVLEQNAEDNGIEVGDRIAVTTRRGERELEVVGIYRFGEGGSALGGTTAVVIDAAQLQRWYGLEGKVSSISVIADDGVSAQALAGRLKALLPGTVKVETATENAAETARRINDEIGAFLTPALLALAGAALLVGAFIIFNTFSITVVQRTREFGLLRALGSTRRQILAIVAGEALLIGVVASGAGLAAGIGFAKLLNALFDAIGFGIPRSALVIAPRTVIVSLVVGIGVTMIASLVPALRATRVAPVTALAGTAPRPSRRARLLANVLTVLCVLAGAGLTAAGLFGSGSATTKLGSAAGGVVLIFIGVAVSARWAVGPLAKVIGWPIERFAGATGRLARENAERNPGRTAVTAAALMVGLGLVVFVAVFTAGLKSSITRQVDDYIRAQLFITGEGFQPLPSRVDRIVAGVPGVSESVPIRFDQLEVNGRNSDIATDVLLAVDLVKLPAVYSFDWVDGSDELLSQVGPGETLIEELFAERHGLGPGDSYEVLTPSGGKETLTAIGVYRDPTILQGSVSDNATLRAISPTRDPLVLLVATDTGADAGEVQGRVESALERFPTANVQSRDEYKQEIEDQLNQIIYLLYALLALSIVISLFGIANSLFLSIHERTRELGVLRAVGATAAQVRRMIRYESVITAIIGGLLGIALGVVFGSLVIGSLSEFGLAVSIPVGQLVIFLALTVVVGVIGAIAPARRAARLDVLDAIHNE